MAKAGKKKAKAKAAGKALKKATISSLKKTSGKKSSKKKAAKKKPAGKQKTGKTSAKKRVRKAVKRRAIKTSRTPVKRGAKETRSRAVSLPKAKAEEERLERQLKVEPGAPAGSIPPVEEPARHEEAIGVVTHYYSHLGVAVVQVNKDSLRTGDIAHVKGHTTDFTQQISSMEYEHQHVDEARAGQCVGLKVTGHAREHDIIYVVR